MKKIISVLFIVFSVFSFSDVVSGKRIQVRGTSTKELLPNSAKITLEIVTENDNLDKASKENSEMLEKYKNLLRKTNTKYEKINSSDYTTSENYWWDTEVQNKGEKEFRTTLTVEVDSIDLNSLLNRIRIIKVLIRNPSIHLIIYRKNFLQKESVQIK